MDSLDPTLAAFRRLLADSSRGGQAKVDALVALSQRTVFVVTWTPGGEDFRSLVNSEGQNALPLFTDLAQLQDATNRFGWSGPDGNTPFKEVGAREALRHTLIHELGFVVVDITSDHAMEIERAEIEPLLQSRHRSDSSGPYAAVGRISETMLQASKSSPAIPAPANLPNVASSPPKEDTGVKPIPRSSAPPGSVRVVPLKDTPPDTLLDALNAALRDFPEVEWAAFCFIERSNEGAATPTVGLRVDTTYRARVGEIVKLVRDTADANGAQVDALLLDDAALLRAVRADSVLFFPWRRRNIP